VTDVTDATFERDVIERSTQVPVVVDLWAEWCGPCRTLGPILEKVSGETQGKVELAKVDTDANPRVAQAFRVQSIPFVVAIKDRQPVGSFLGAQGEAYVRDFVAQLLPTEEEGEVAKLLAAGDEDSLRRALELDPDHEGVIVALAHLMVEADRPDEALELIARIPESPETRHVAALARHGGELTGSDIDAELTALLEQVKDDADARQRFLDLLELLGPDDPRTSQYRRQLTARIY
jgi:putative thioredoxin